MYILKPIKVFVQTLTVNANLIFESAEVHRHRISEKRK